MVVLYWSWLRTVIISNSPAQRIRRQRMDGERAFPLGVVKLPSRGRWGGRTPGLRTRSL